MTFNFMYRSEFYISCEADNEEEARTIILNGIGTIKIVSLGGLWDDYLELDEEYENYQEV